MLTAMYGASWRVPDPAFHFAPPIETIRRLNGWFRGLRVGRSKWDRVYSRRQPALPTEPSPFLAWALEREPDAASYVDLGCGRGSDVLWMAGRGVPSVGLDFQPRSYAAAAAREVPGAEFWRCNLLELRDVLPAGAELARRPGPRLLVARHLVDTLDRPAREHLYRLARMALAGEGGGRLHLEFLARFGDDGYAKGLHVKRRRPRMLVAELRAGWCDDRAPRDDPGDATRRGPRRSAGWSWNGGVEMAEAKTQGVAERAREAVSLRRRVARLEAEVQECRALNVRLAELTDIVTELLLPVAARDEEKLAALLEKYRQSV